MSRASVDALPLIHPTFSAINLGLRDLSRVSTLHLNSCQKKQEIQAVVFMKLDRMGKAQRAHHFCVHPRN
jgi:hypothetical protein